MVCQARNLNWMIRPPMGQVRGGKPHSRTVSEGREELGREVEVGMPLVNCEIDPAVLGSPCPELGRHGKGSLSSQVTSYELNSEAVGNEGQEEIHSRGVAPCFKTPTVSTKARAQRDQSRNLSKKRCMSLPPHQLQVPKGLLLCCCPSHLFVPGRSSAAFSLSPKSSPSSPSAQAGLWCSLPLRRHHEL